jgi:2-dehydro-3-deoxyphosphogluconate aldolase / (4S)-4-hydroxy-2-oxoglutarate aldolase
MDKFAAIQYLLTKYIVAIIRADSDRDLIDIVRAVAAGGVHCIEVTMTTPGAIQAIEKSRKELAKDDVLLGVGSVLDAETCRLAILAGAQYVVSPVVSIPVIEMARRYGKPVLPGALTPTEILAAWEHGADLVKVFPSDVGGAAYIKAIKGPLPQIPLVPTGSVSAENLKDFVAAGAAAVGVGGNLVSKKLVEARDFDGITKNARRFADAVAAARSAG